MNIVCFSHLRWNFVYQRPQHLLSRFARNEPVYYIEEPLFDAPDDSFKITETKEKVQVVNLYLKGSPHEDNIIDRQKVLVSGVFKNENISDYLLWYYTPMALLISDHLKPKMIVYDCMDELSAFKFAPPILKQLEEDLFNSADIVFTGGHTLYEAKKNQHHNIYPFPSSIDKAHFAAARTGQEEPADQKEIPHPRLGFYGVIDERFDLDLIHETAKQKPDWHFVLIGPIVKIDPATLPRLANIHYLGGKSYNELPTYLSGWDIALIPFLLNESTRFISPTKTPEYLAGGKPVISTAIKDVVHPYAVEALVDIVKNAEEFVGAADKTLTQTEANRETWLAKTDVFLKDNSWDTTWKRMNSLIESTFAEKSRSMKQMMNTNTKKEDAYV